MNLMQSFIAGCILIAAAQTGLGQEAPKAVLVDDFGKLPCDDRMARLDHLFVELANNPDSQGLVAIEHSPGQRIDAVSQQVMIERYTRFRRFDLGRLTVIRSIGSNDLTVRFWRVPFGAAEPEIDPNVSFEMTAKTKPFVFASEDAEGQVECSEFDPEIFAQFLKANPTARANIVFRDRSASYGRRRAKAILSDMTEKYGVEKSRIRTYFVRPRVGSYEPITEFWYLP